MPTPEVRVACARPRDFAGETASLESLLDAAEREAARRFRNELDRDAYVVAHALRRALLADETRLETGTIRIGHDSRGQPFLAVPGGDAIHFSHSRQRNAVACAVTRSAPIGIDVEYIDPGRADAGLLSRFMDLAAGGAADAYGFYRHWTALEAFWKACGTGLAEGQPRIRCAMRARNRFDISFESGEPACVARGFSIDAFDDCAMTLVVRAPMHRDMTVRRIQCSCAMAIVQLGHGKTPNADAGAPNIHM
jgi:4'-phosphopantetheinyl transferase